jgi:Flp pilus assembly pilin Flp
MNQLPRLAGDDSGSCLTEHKLLVVLIGIAIFLAAMDLGATLYHFFQEGQAHNAL